MTPSHNPHSRRLLEELVRNAKQHGLVLFVGAGINARATRQWTALLQRLLERTLKEASFSDPGFDVFTKHLSRWTQNTFEPCALAWLIKSILGPERFRLEIQDAIYETLPNVESRLLEYCENHAQDQPPEDTERFEMLRATAKLASSPCVRAVATFNYDTLLESAVRKLAFRHARPYYGQAPAPPPLIERQKPVLPVFHVHGLLSPPNSILRDANESAILSYDEYFDKNADPMSWETSTSIHFLRNYCTLWLGTSLKDWNMLRLLYAAKSQRETPPSYCLMCLDEVKPAQALQPPLPQKYEAKDEKEAQQAFVEQCKGYFYDHNDLNSALRRFQRVAMRLQATVLENAGVKLIVAGPSYSDIPLTIENAITHFIPPLHQEPSPEPIPTS